MTRSIGLLGLKLLVSGGLLYWVLGSIDRDALFDAVITLDPIFVLAAFGALVLQYPVGALRWFEILKLLDFPLAWREVFRVHLVGVFLNQMLPSALGGDAYRVWSTGRVGNGWGKAVSSVLLDRVAALLILILLLLAMLPRLVDILPGGPIVGSLTVLVCAAAVSIPVFFFVARPVAKLLEMNRFTRRLGPIARNADLLWSKGAASFRIAGFGLLTQLSTAACVWLIALAAGANVDFFTMLGLTLPVLLTLALPISIAGWGVREGAMVFALGLIGVSAETGLLVSLVWGGLSLVGGVACGIAFLLQGSERHKLAVYAAENANLSERED
ncbi:lysylphosphatidylglycerol synthase transmembrane domain-containing protein [Nisaea denitrificans]|uniref:lysylphosphatidylglycerol synthase transmembrane domain-containing protein n=1 Tax=Nisaea denitrificans TaxID=390877 RepID=UPI0004051EED|nr:lysylphosphatidylglycerol synthase transmembrane domain-containing protein [Nisaea denitrificans]